MAFKTKEQREAEATGTTPPPAVSKTEAPVRVARRTDIVTLEKANVKIPAAENRPPADPVEHFRRTACENGHVGEWDPKKVMYSIDHRSFLIYCTPCGEFSVIPAGSPIPLSVPGGLVPGTNG